MTERDRRRPRPVSVDGGQVGVTQTSRLTRTSTSPGPGGSSSNFSIVSGFDIAYGGWEPMAPSTAALIRMTALSFGQHENDLEPERILRPDLLMTARP